MNETNKKRARFYRHDRQRDGVIKFSHNDRLWKKDYFHPGAKPKPSQYTDLTQLELLAYNVVFLINCPIYPDDRVYPTMEQYDMFTMVFEPLYTVKKLEADLVSDQPFYNIYYTKDHH